MTIYYVMMINKEDASYIAGLFDGEGNYAWNTNKNPRLRIGMSDKPPIDYMFQKFPLGKYYEVQPKKGKRQYILCISRKEDVALFFQIIGPYLKLKTINNPSNIKKIDPEKLRNFISYVEQSQFSIVNCFQTEKIS